MRKSLFTFAIFTALLFASSCVSEYCPINNGGGNGLTGNEHFQLRLSVAGSSLNTRITIPSEFGEDDVQTLHVLFFSNEDAPFTKNGTVINPGDFIDYVALTNGGSPLDLNANLLVRFREQPNLNNQTNYSLLLVANVEDYVSSVSGWLSTFDNTTFSAVVNDVISLNLFGVGVSDTQIVPDRLLMTATATKSAHADIVDVTLTRAVVRVDVNLRAGLEYDLVSASIWNVPSTTSLWDASNNNYNNFITNHTTRAFQRVEFATPVRYFRGGLYTFENRQSGIFQNDERTTAVILGLRSQATGQTRYFRANIVPPFAAQDMRRNTVHNVTVNHVLAEGAMNPADAYSEENFLLQTTINNADMDNRGVILIDGDNVLVLPTNRIAFGPEGGSRTFTIFTYSPNPAMRLGISGLRMDAGLEAYLCMETNLLTVTAQPGVVARNGYIEFRFGNLIARIEVVQEATFVEYLELNLQMRDIPQFPNYFPVGTTRLAMDDFVQVTSSGEWTATMFNHENFGFDLTGLSGSFFLPSSDRVIRGETGAQFRLDAAGGNTEDFVRYGFVIVSLVSNPNINRVLIVTQGGRQPIRVFHPNHQNEGDELSNPRVYFDALGNWSNLVNTRAATGHIPSLTYVITHSEHGRAPADWIRVRTTTTGANALTDAEVQALFPLTFVVEPCGMRTHVTIGAGTRNAVQNRPITAYVYIGFPGIIPERIFIEQGRFIYPTMTFPTGNTPVVGQTTGNMVAATRHLIGGVATGSTLADVILPWSATIACTGSVVDYHPVTDLPMRTRTLALHEAVMLTTADAALPAGIQTDRLEMRVRFPKVFYPNRRIPITTTIEVTCDFSGDVRTFARAQEPLLPRDFNVRSQQDNVTSGGDAQGGLHTGTNTGMELLRDHIRNQATTITTNIAWGGGWTPATSAAPNAAVFPIPGATTNLICANATMVYTTQAGFSSTNRPGRWPTINTWHRDGIGITATDTGTSSRRLLWMNTSIHANIDGVNVGATAVQGGGNSPAGAPAVIGETQPIRRSPLQLAGFPTVNSSTTGATTAVLFPRQANNYRIYDFIVSRPDNDNVPVVPSVSLAVTNNTSWMIVGTNGANLPASAVPILQRGTANPTHASLVICPVNYLIWMADGELFRTANDTPDNRRFMYNLVTFANNAARYGEHFMYLFRQNATLPAIWDAQWGNNTNVDFTYPASLQN